MNVHQFPSVNTLVVSMIVVSLAAPVTALAETELERLRAEVAALSQPHLINDADIRVKVSQSILTKATQFISALPVASRTARFDGTSKQGNIYNSGGGFAGCGAFAEISDGGQNLHIVLVLNSFQTAWQEDGKLGVRIAAGVTANGNIHGHVRGAAGACEGPSLKYPLGRWSCDCPIGGGAGTNVGITATAASTLQGQMAFSPGTAGDLVYSLSLNSPKSIPLQVGVGLKQIGNIPFSLSLDVPNGPIAGGKGFGVVKTSGNLRIGDKDRPYKVQVSSPILKADKTGVDLRAKASVQM